MGVPVLVVADEPSGRAIRTALDTFDVTVVEDVVRARALVATGAFRVVFATFALAPAVHGAVVLDASTSAANLASAVGAAVAQATLGELEQARTDAVGELAYEEYAELARYALTRRYLLALLGRHNGSVTDAARGASMKRESLHRLMRRFQVSADEFRSH